MLLLCSKSSNVSFAQIKNPNPCHHLQSLIRSGCPSPPPPLPVLIFYNSLQSVMVDSLNPANMLLPHGLSTSVPLCVTLYPAYPPSSYSVGIKFNLPASPLLTVVFTTANLPLLTLPHFSLLFFLQPFIILYN